MESIHVEGEKLTDKKIFESEILEEREEEIIEEYGELVEEEEEEEISEGVIEKEEEFQQDEFSEDTLIDIVENTIVEDRVVEEVEYMEGYADEEYDEIQEGETMEEAEYMKGCVDEEYDEIQEGETMEEDEYMTKYELIENTKIVNSMQESSDDKRKVAEPRGEKSVLEDILGEEEEEEDEEEDDDGRRDILTEEIQDNKKADKSLNISTPAHAHATTHSLSQRRIIKLNQSARFNNKTITKYAPIDNKKRKFDKSNRNEDKKKIKALRTKKPEHKAINGDAKSYHSKSPPIKIASVVVSMNDDLKNKTKDIAKITKGVVLDLHEPKYRAYINAIEHCNETIRSEEEDVLYGLHEMFADNVVDYYMKCPMGTKTDIAFGLATLEIVNVAFFLNGGLNIAHPPCLKIFTTAPKDLWKIRSDFLLSLSDMAVFSLMKSESGNVSSQDKTRQQNCILMRDRMIFNTKVMCNRIIEWCNERLTKPYDDFIKDSIANVLNQVDKCIIWTEKSRSDDIRKGELDYEHRNEMRYEFLKLTNYASAYELSDKVPDRESKGFISRYNITRRKSNRNSDFGIKSVLDCGIHIYNTTSTRNEKSQLYTSTRRVAQSQIANLKVLESRGFEIEKIQNTSHPFKLDSFSIGINYQEYKKDGLVGTQLSHSVHNDVLVIYKIQNLPSLYSLMLESSFGGKQLYDTLMHSKLPLQFPSGKDDGSLSQRFGVSQSILTSQYDWHNIVFDGLEKLFEFVRLSKLILWHKLPLFLCIWKGQKDEKPYISIEIDYCTGFFEPVGIDPRECVTMSLAPEIFENRKKGWIGFSPTRESNLWDFGLILYDIWERILVHPNNHLNLSFGMDLKRYFEDKDKKITLPFNLGEVPLNWEIVRFLSLNPTIRANRLGDLNFRKFGSLNGYLNVKATQLSIDQPLNDIYHLLWNHANRSEAMDVANLIYNWEWIEKNADYSIDIKEKSLIGQAKNLLETWELIASRRRSNEKDLGVETTNKHICAIAEFINRDIDFCGYVHLENYHMMMITSETKAMREKLISAFIWNLLDDDFVRTENNRFIVPDHSISDFKKLAKFKNKGLILFKLVYNAACWKINLVLPFPSFFLRYLFGIHQIDDFGIMNKWAINIALETKKEIKDIHISGCSPASITLNPSIGNSIDHTMESLNQIIITDVMRGRAKHLPASWGCFITGFKTGFLTTKNEKSTCDTLICAENIMEMMKSKTGYKSLDVSVYPFLCTSLCNSMSAPIFPNALDIINSIQVKWTDYGDTMIGSDNEEEEGVGVGVGEGEEEGKRKSKKFQHKNINKEIEKCIRDGCCCDLGDPCIGANMRDYLMSKIRDKGNFSNWLNYGSKFDYKKKITWFISRNSGLKKEPTIIPTSNCDGSSFITSYIEYLDPDKFIYFFDLSINNYVFTMGKMMDK